MMYYKCTKDKSYTRYIKEGAVKKRSLKKRARDSKTNP